MAIAQPTMRAAFQSRVPLRPVAHVITRGRVLNWIRNTHLWIGLWGAVLGFMFGVTGLLMNHRFVMKFAVQTAETTRTRIAIPSAFEHPDQLTTWLRGRFSLPQAPVDVRIEMTERVRFLSQELVQAERWTVTLASTRLSVHARHVPGSGVIELETQDATRWGLLMRLHTGSGASAAWVLIVDTIAGAFIVLTMSGVLLWTKLRWPRLAGAAVLVGAPTLTAVYLATV